MISSSLDSMMSFDIYTVADMSTFPEISSDSIKELTVEDAEGTKTLDKEENASAFSAIGSLYYTSQVDYNCEDMSKYGLDEPAYTVTIKYLEEAEEESPKAQKRPHKPPDAAAESGETSDETGESGETLEETEETYDEADLTTVVLYIGSASDSGLCPVRRLQRGSYDQQRRRSRSDRVIWKVCLYKEGSLIKDKYLQENSFMRQDSLA